MIETPTPEGGVNNSEKEQMQQHILDLQKQNDDFIQQYQKMQEETERLQRAKAEIEEKARKDREENERILNK